MIRSDEAHTLRFSELVGAHSLVAPSRAAVLSSSDPLAGLPTIAGPCPFCPGNDAEERVVLEVPGESGWRARVVWNKYPAVHDVPTATTFAEGGPIEEALGHHELVIESPEHDADFATYDEAHAYVVLSLFRERTRALEALPSARHVSLFRNRGRRSGASQPHPHSQLVATKSVGLEPNVRWDRAVAHHVAHGRTLLDTMIDRERAIGERVVEEDEHAIAFVPFAPQRTRECYLAPRHARGSISAVDDATLRAFARLLPRTIRRVQKGSGRTDYNLLFRLPPVAHRGHDAAFWYVEIVPRGATYAGFELVAGMPLISENPERTAAIYRATEP